MSDDVPIKKKQHTTKKLIQALSENTRYLLDVDLDDIHGCIYQVLDDIKGKKEFGEAYYKAVKKALKRNDDKGVDLIQSGVAVIHKQVEEVGPPIQYLIRLKDPLEITDEHDVQTQFVWVLVSNQATHPLMKRVAEFVHLMDENAFRQAALVSGSADELIELYEKSLDEEIHFAHIPPELEATGKFMGGMIRDFKRRAPYWGQDFKDGFNSKVLASVMFMYFACLAPAVAFGALLSTLTNGQIGAIETILASAICGLLWAIFSGQPLIVIGATGPNVVFTGILFVLCQKYQIPFLSTAFWVGMWTMLYMWILAATDASSLIRFFTRFTDEIFAALISLIFVVEAIKDLMKGFQNSTDSHDAALLSLFLALTTFTISMTLSRVRRTPYLRFQVREFLSDFGPSISIVLVTLLAYQFIGIHFDTLAVPAQFAPSIDRNWLVNPFEVPMWVWFASAIPAILLTILIWVNQNITARLVNSPDHKMKKGATYHWDIALTGTLIGIMSTFGMPWVVGAAVRSLNHTRSLLVIKKGKTVGTLENRVSGLAVHILISLSLLILPVLQYIPMSVLFGLFLFMGLGSLGSSQFIERTRLWFLDPKLYQINHRLRVVPTTIIHKFTLLQVVCLSVLWIVKESPIGILFPLFVALLIPVRMLLARYMEPEYIALLDAAEQPDEELYRDFGST